MLCLVCQPFLALPFPCRNETELGLVGPISAQSSQMDVVFIPHFCTSHSSERRTGMSHCDVKRLEQQTMSTNPSFIKVYFTISISAFFCTDAETQRK